MLGIEPGSAKYKVNYLPLFYSSGSSWELKVNWRPVCGRLSPFDDQVAGTPLLYQETSFHPSPLPAFFSSSLPAALEGGEACDARRWDGRSLRRAGQGTGHGQHQGPACLGGLET